MEKKYTSEDVKQIVEYQTKVFSEIIGDMFKHLAPMRDYPQGYQGEEEIGGHVEDRQGE